jgi:hypothetical protein
MTPAAAAILAILTLTIQAAIVIGIAAAAYRQRDQL